MATWVALFIAALVGMLAGMLTLKMLGQSTPLG